MAGVASPSNGQLEHARADHHPFVVRVSGGAPGGDSVVVPGEHRSGHSTVAVGKRDRRRAPHRIRARPEEQRPEHRPIAGCGDLTARMTALLRRPPVDRPRDPVAVIGDGRERGAPLLRCAEQLPPSLRVPARLEIGLGVDLPNRVGVRVGPVERPSRSIESRLDPGAEADGAQRAAECRVVSCRSDESRQASVVHWFPEPRAAPQGQCRQWSAAPLTSTWRFSGSG